MKIACIQMEPKWLDRNANYKTVENLVARARKKHRISLFILPELFATGGLGEKSEEYAELSSHGKTALFLRRLAFENKAWIVGSLASGRRGFGKPYNTCLVVDPDGKIAKIYDKINLFPPSGEDKNYSPGYPQQSCTFEIDGFRFGVIICFDLRFPELAMRLAADKVDCMIVCANWSKKRWKDWDILLKARAIENRFYVAGCNSVGKNNHVMHMGRSAIITPDGTAVAAALDGKNVVIGAVLDKKLIEQSRAEFDCAAIRAKRGRDRNGNKDIRDRHGCEIEG